MDVTIIRDSAVGVNSGYRWVNIEAGGNRVGKARIRASGRKLVIHSIQIYPQFQGEGYGRKTIDTVKQTYRWIVADRVRNKATGFWQKMGFRLRQDGDYVWERGDG